MAATNGALIAQYQSFATVAPFLASAFTDNNLGADLLQIATANGDTVVVAVQSNGTVNFNASGLTGTRGAGGAGLYTKGRTLVGRFRCRVGDTITTVASAFASAFPTNPQNLDIIQVVAEGGNPGYYVSYLGVANGS